MIRSPLKARLGNVNVYPTASEAMAVALGASARLNRDGISSPTSVGEGYIAYVHVKRSLTASDSSVIPSAVVVDDAGKAVGLAFEEYTDSCDSGHFEQWVEYFDGQGSWVDHTFIPT